MGGRWRSRPPAAAARSAQDFASWNWDEDFSPDINEIVDLWYDYVSLPEDTIAKKSNPLTLYFGCYSEDHGQGGLGMLQWSATHTGLSQTLKPVTSNGQPVYGGALFLVENRDVTCNLEADDGDLCQKTEQCSCASQSSADRLSCMESFFISSVITTFGIYEMKT